MCLGEHGRDREGTGGRRGRGVKGSTSRGSQLSSVFSPISQGALKGPQYCPQDHITAPCLSQLLGGQAGKENLPGSSVSPGQVLGEGEGMYINFTDSIAAIPPFI